MYLCQHSKSWFLQKNSKNYGLQSMIENVIFIMEHPVVSSMILYPGYIMLSLCFLQVPLEKSSIQHLASRIQYDTRPRLRYGQLGFPASCLRKIQNLVSSVQHLESSMILDPDYVMVSLGFLQAPLEKSSIQYLVSSIQNLV